MTARDLRFYLFLTACVWAYLVARATLVPWVHDECASLMWYAEPGVFLPPQAHADANNHVLSSAFGALFIRLFGLSLLASRLASLLAFALYAFAVWRLGAYVRSGLLCWCLRAVLLFCPFLFEFFALFRGYALEMAFLAVAVEGGLRWARTRSLPAFVQLLSGIALADLSVLALVPLWVLLIAFLAGLLVIRRRLFERRTFLLHAIVLLALGVLPAIWGSAQAFDLRAKGLLYHGSTEGFLPVTVGSLSRLVLGLDGTSISLTVAIVCLFPLGATIAMNAWRRPLGMVTVAFLCDVSMRIAMAWTLEVNYPEDRAGIHLLWLALFSLVLAVDELATVRPGARWAGLLLILLPLRSLWSVNVDRTALWPEQSVPGRFVDRLAALQREARRPLVIGAYHQMELTLPYAARARAGTAMRPHTQRFPEGTDDARVVDDRYLPRAAQGFTEIDASPANQLHLLVRERPLRSRPMLAFVRKSSGISSRNFEVWEGSAEKRVFLVEIACTLPMHTPLQDLLLVASTTDVHGKDLVYEAIHPSAAGLAESGGRYRTMIRFEPAPGSKKHLLYFWNGTGAPLAITDVDVRVSLLE